MPWLILQPSTCHPYLLWNDRFWYRRVFDVLIMKDTLKKGLWQKKILQTIFQELRRLRKLMVCTEISHLGDLTNSTTGKHNNEDIRKSRRRANISNSAGQRGPAVKGPCCQAGGLKTDPPNQVRGTDSRRLSFDTSRVCSACIPSPHQ